MSRMIGTVARGVRAPIIRAGDDLAKIVPESVLAAAQEAGFQFHDRDVVAMTEAIVARAQGNYAKVGDIAADVKAKLGGGTVGVIFPILSRNRFAVCLPTKNRNITGWLCRESAKERRYWTASHIWELLHSMQESQEQKT